MKDSNGYYHIDQRIHQLSQIIAKVNRTYVPNKADDSHTNLYFDPFSHRIYGRWIDANSGRIILALSLDQSSFQWLNQSMRTLRTLSVEGQIQDQLELALEQTLKDFGLDPTGFREKLHFEIPDYSFLGQPYGAFYRSDQTKWERYRKIANEACYQLSGYFQVEAEVRIWPHHFDTAIYFEIGNKLGLGFGLAMKDERAGDAYFYLSGYGLEGYKVNYLDVPTLPTGRWIISEGWKGAILPISSFSGKSQQLAGFLRELTAWISAGQAIQDKL